MSISEIITINENLILKVCSSEFASSLYEIVDNNREYFNNYLAWSKFVKSEEDEAKFLDLCLKKHEQNEAKTYVILYNDKPVGIIGFNSIDKGNKIAEIGYWLDPRISGKGIISQSVKNLVKYYTKNNQINRFVIKCSVHNIKSNAVAKRCNFQIEGTLRQAEYLNGIFYDQNIYSYIGQK